SAPPAAEGLAPDSENRSDMVRTDPKPEQKAAADFWRTPIGIVLFLLISALLYGFLDPAFGMDPESAAAYAGLAAGLVVTLLAFCIPIAVLYRRSAVRFFPRALPGTLAVGLACVLLTRFTDFHP